MKIEIPYALVVPDNRRLTVLRGKALLSPRYRQAKEKLTWWLRSQYRGAQLHTGPVQIHARAFFPDARRRDAGNGRKLVTDAMEGIVYLDDTQIWKETWERMGIDRTNPRLEVVIEPYKQEAA